MLMISKERLLREKENTGFRQEIIEKVVWLIELLNSIAEDSYLSNRLALKGGTALNLFYFDLPRLSVDADLNYIGAVDRQIMLKERPEIERRVKGLCERMGLNLTRNPNKHAGGKMVWRYPSAFGNQGNTEIDLNFMYRVPLLETEHKNSIEVAGKYVEGLQILDIHELAAGKLTALLERQTGRDFFDANQLFQYPKINHEKLRSLFVAYSAMCSKKDMLTITLNEIAIDSLDIKNRLIPVLKNNFLGDFSSVDVWINHLANQVQIGYKKLLPFKKQELAFIRSIVTGEGIKPDLFIGEEKMIALIKIHPALLWASSKNI